MSMLRKGEPPMRESVDLSTKSVPFFEIWSKGKPRKEQTALKILKNPLQETCLRSEKSYRLRESFGNRESKLSMKNFWKNTKRCIQNSTNSQPSTLNRKSSSIKCWEMCWRRWRLRSERAKDRDRKCSNQFWSWSRRFATRPWKRQGWDDWKNDLELQTKWNQTF